MEDAGKKGAFQNVSRWMVGEVASAAATDEAEKVREAISRQKKTSVAPSSFFFPFLNPNFLKECGLQMEL